MFETRTFTYYLDHLEIIADKIGDERLIVTEFGSGGRIQPQGGCLQAARSAEERARKLTTYQHEIQRFGEFLKYLE